MKFVLGITNFQRLEYLKKLLTTWEQTKSDNEWRIIIADDGSDYLDEISLKDYDLTIIRCKDVGVHNLTNAIFKEIDGTDFDMCFKVDNDIYFKQPDWDTRYYELAMNSGYHHLIYNRNNYLKNGIVATPHQSNGKIGDIPTMYGCFYTITQEVLDKVGYFDIDNFGKAIYGHWDYSVRCCNAGFNELTKQYDIGGSYNYIEMQGKDGEEYVPTNIFQDKVHKYGLDVRTNIKKRRLIKKRAVNGKTYIGEEV